MRVDFYHQATTITNFDGDMVITKTVDAWDIAQALASEMSFSTGLLPQDALWWRNTRSGPQFALYEPPRVRILALQEFVDKPPRRFTVPLPGLIFLCQPGQAPWVYAVKKRPTKESDPIYGAPFSNIFDNGRSCAGSNKYPTRVRDIVDSFFLSFFTTSADKDHRSKRFPQNVLHLWEFLDKKKTYPLEDLVQHGTVIDLMQMEMTHG